MADKKKPDVVVLQTTSPDDGGIKIVQEFLPETAKNILAAQKVSGNVFWEKAPAEAHVTKKLVVADPDDISSLSFVEQVDRELNPSTEQPAK